MSQIPAQLKYTKSHEWIEYLEGGIIKIGITDYAQEQLGDIVFIQFPEIAQNVQAGDDCAVIESVKTASDIFSPLNGKIIAINEALEEQPESINIDPYQAGWILKIQPADDTQGDFLDHTQYLKIIEE